MTMLIYPIVFLVHLFITLYFYVTNTYDSNLNYFYNVSQTALIILPTVVSLRYRQQFPRLRPLLTPLIISNIFFASAFYLWFYYNISGIPTPFPSLADVFFLLFYPANIWALIQLKKLTETTWSSESWISFIATFLILKTLSLGFLLSQAVDPTDSWIMILLNLLYPLLDCFIAALGLTILRSQSHLGYRYLFFYVFGYLFLGFSDTLFSFQTNHDYYWNGSLVDLLFVLSYTLIALGTHYLPTLFAPNAVASSNTGPSPSPESPSPIER